LRPTRNRQAFALRTGSTRSTWPRSIRPSIADHEIARLTPGFANVSYDMLDERGSVRWPCNHKAGGVADHARQWLRARRGQVHRIYRDRREDQPRFPLLLRTGRILSQYNVGTQTSRTANSLWYKEDLLEIHPQDAEQRGIRDATAGGSPAARARRARKLPIGWPQAWSTPRSITPHAGERHHHRLFRPGTNCPVTRRAGLAVKRSVTPGGGL
jgi:Molydopterin dinucleotide binding domain